MNRLAAFRVRTAILRLKVIYMICKKFDISIFITKSFINNMKDFFKFLMGLSNKFETLEYTLISFSVLEGSSIWATSSLKDFVPH